jgi:hypothetical protein
LCRHGRAIVARSRGKNTSGEKPNVPRENFVRVSRIQRLAPCAPCRGCSEQLFEASGHQQLV